MSLEKLPSGQFKVRWHDAGIHRAKTFPKGEHKLARAFEEEVKRAKRLGHLPQLEAGKHTIGEVASKWWVSNGSQKAPRTVELYDSLLHKHVLPTFDSKRLGEVGVAEIEAWLADLDTGATAKRNALGVLSRIFNYALRAGYVQGNPCQVVHKPKLPDKEPINPPSPLEVERIRAKLFDADRPGDAFMVGFLAYAGPRSQEVRDLDWTDIRDRTVLLRSSKTGRHRAVRLLSPLAADLAAWKLSLEKPTIPVFPSPTGLRMTKATWDNWRNRVWSKVAPEGMRPYDLRHFYVSSMLRDPKVSRIEAAEQAGHTLQQQEDYAHLIGEGSADFENTIRAARAEVFGDERQEAV